MTTVRDLTTDLDDIDLEIVKTLFAKLRQPSRTSGHWPRAVEQMLHGLCAAVDEELHRRRWQVQALNDTFDQGGVGSLAADDDEDLSGWVDGGSP